MNTAAGESERVRTAANDGRPRYAIIAGFGLSGRSCANVMIEQGVEICVIEKNAVTVERCALSGLRIIGGDASDPRTLRLAGIDRATEVAVTIPNDDAAMRVVEVVHQMNPCAHIIARCTFVSGGMEAHKRGANEVVVAE